MAPVNETDLVLLPQGLHALKQVAKQIGLNLRGAYLNLDGGFDSARNRKCIFNAGLIPNIPENPRNRKRPKRGRKRLFNGIVKLLRLMPSPDSKGHIVGSMLTDPTLRPPALSL